MRPKLPPPPGKPVQPVMPKPGKPGKPGRGGGKPDMPIGLPTPGKPGRGGVSPVKTVSPVKPVKGAGGSRPKGTMGDGVGGYNRPKGAGAAAGMAVKKMMGMSKGGMTKKGKK